MNKHLSFLKYRKSILIATICAGCALVVLLTTKQHTVDFNTEVKPIINTSCISCHGGVKSQAEFSLLFREDALAVTESGKPSIIPGDPGNSEMIRRLTLDDPEERMPYKHEKLSSKEIKTLREWVKQGAVWGDHWAYVPVEKVEPPKPKGWLWGLIPASQPKLVKNNIDYFIYDKIQKEKLKPSPEADKASLLRRVSLDLIGLPASESVTKSFLESQDESAYEVLVDSLLASIQFGERWTSVWLDIARYADTKGYERDDGRNVWRYRDWLINAFNEDKPYDVFITEQLAGDLMPNPTDDQYIATVFHRNTMTNDEGGTDNEEFRTAAVLDRVNTTFEGLMSTTFACIQCHSHPYDPFKHEEYYEVAAFFNNTRDEDTYADYPVLRHYKEEDYGKLDSIVNWVNNYGTKEKAKEVNTFLKTWQPAINSLVADNLVNSELNDTKWLRFRNNGSARLPAVDLTNKSQLMFRYASYLPGGIWKIHLDKPDGVVLKTILPEQTNGWEIITTDIPLTKGVHDLYLSYTNSNLKNPDQGGLQFDWFYFSNPLPGKENTGFDKIEKSYWQLMNARVSSTPIMMDNPKDMHRETNVFERGNWLVKGEKVEPGVPASLNPMPEGAPKNRLGLAMWMTDKQNPLTSRTMVNRLWEQLFGVGLVETMEDMGTQGAIPTHRELLDYLSYKFMYDYEWSMKKVLKEIVLSATYRQDAKTSKELLEKDPLNRFYARGVRVRLSAEQIRDQALALSGLLSHKMYGPSVMPWQPEGIWMSPYSGAVWQKSEGEDQYRRGVYTYWKRTAPYPSMVTFDGATRDLCSTQRIRTNTPLQALVTLNDSVYLESAKHFAFLMRSECSDQKDMKNVISKGYEIALLKTIDQQRLNSFMKLYEDALRQYKNDAKKTTAMLGEENKKEGAETAALILVANAMLNMDELITKN
jgi:hypothetical protein